MIVTVTPNPSLDRTLHLPRLEPGAVNRATATMTEPSGKGVNVALALHGVGVEVCAVLPVGGSTGRELLSALDRLGLDTVGVPIAGAVRSNVSLVEADGRSTKVNEPGPALVRRRGRRIVRRRAVGARRRPGAVGGQPALGLHRRAV